MTLKFLKAKKQQLGPPKGELKSPFPLSTTPTNKVIKRKAYFFARVTQLYVNETKKGFLAFARLIISLFSN